MRNTERRIARNLGVTVAGLKYLAKMYATGYAPQRGNEAHKLERDGLLRKSGNSAYSAWRCKPWEITESGKRIVERARAAGW